MPESNPTQKFKPFGIDELNINGCCESCSRFCGLRENLRNTLIRMTAFESMHHSLEDLGSKLRGEHILFSLAERYMTGFYRKPSFRIDSGGIGYAAGRAEIWVDTFDCKRINVCCRVRPDKCVSSAEFDTKSRTFQVPQEQELAVLEHYEDLHAAVVREDRKQRYIEWRKRQEERKRKKL